MKFTDRKKHMIDFIFPVALLFVFAVSALVVTLFAANSYQGTVEDSARNSSAPTTLAYVTEKIHAGDEAGRIEATEFDGCSAVAIKSEINGEEYVTYIYHYDGQIRELFVKSGMDFTAESGSGIISAKDFQVEEMSPGLLLLNCTDEKGKNASSAVSIRSR